MAAPVPFDPFSLVASGIGTLATGVGAGVQAARLPAAKRKYIRDQRFDALHNMRRQHAAELGYPVGYDGKYIAKKIQREADEKFQVDPLSFVPFVQNATQFAGDLYDAGLETPPDDTKRNEQYRLPPPPGGYNADPEDVAERAQAMQAFLPGGEAFETAKKKGWKY